ncbi:MAG TPA: hypothetical protein VGS18_01625, partial [Thermoplasmata archaeon]|nr:hypothetical protein [Thermoplasmata archaeon]
MSWPGPAYWPWAAELALLALGFVVLGEAVRRPLARWSVFLADPSPIARLLIDLYVGGGLLYLLVALPLGGFFEGTVPALLGIGGIALAVELARSPGPSRLPERFMAWIRCLGRPAPLIAVASALVLGLGELAIAFPIPTGNTFDSGVLTYFVSRLVGLHHIAYTYLPSTPFALAYPQGTTAWLGAYQSVYGLPPARTSLLVTPLFFALAPLGAYVVGERLIGRPSDGALLAIVFAFVGSWTRVLVGGSNDFVAAFPLVLLLFAGLSPWHGRTLLRWGDALSFGALAGVAASLNPAGPIWVLLTIAALAPFARPAFSGRPFPWIARWAAAV